MKDLSLSLTYRKLVETPFSSEANVYVAALLQEAMVKYNDPDRIRTSWWLRASWRRLQLVNRYAFCDSLYESIKRYFQYVKWEL